MVHYHDIEVSHVKLDKKNHELIQIVHETSRILR